MSRIEVLRTLALSALAKLPPASGVVRSESEQAVKAVASANNPLPGADVVDEDQPLASHPDAPVRVVGLHSIDHVAVGERRGEPAQALGQDRCRDADSGWGALSTSQSINDLVDDGPVANSRAAEPGIGGGEVSPLTASYTSLGIGPLTPASIGDTASRKLSSPMTVSANAVLPVKPPAASITFSRVIPRACAVQKIGQADPVDPDDIGDLANACGQLDIRLHIAVVGCWRLRRGGCDACGQRCRSSDDRCRGGSGLGLGQTGRSGL